MAYPPGEEPGPIRQYIDWVRNDPGNAIAITLVAVIIAPLAFLVAIGVIE